MREIKFRAWNKKERKMYLVAKINFAYLRVICYEKDKALIGYEFNFKEIILVQYTGLKDKNGVEIYEGDIVKMELKKTVVKGKIKYHPSSFYLATDCDLWDLDNYKSIEIIGNIYENPGLLKEKS